MKKLIAVLLCVFACLGATAEEVKVRGHKEKCVRSEVDPTKLIAFCPDTGTFEEFRTQDQYTRAESIKLIFVSADPDVRREEMYLWGATLIDVGTTFAARKKLGPNGHEANMLMRPLLDGGFAMTLVQQFAINKLVGLAAEQAKAAGWKHWNYIPRAGVVLHGAAGAHNVYVMWRYEFKQ